jgi:hypothetical protein
MSHDLELPLGLASPPARLPGRQPISYGPRSVRLWIEATVSARTLQSARRCAGRRVAAHAGLADIDALAHLLRVVILVQPRDADPLLIGVSRFIGAAGQKQGDQTQAQRSHVLGPPADSDGTI